LGAFGDKLRKQREQRGIALETISNTTKISPRMLRALEEEQFDQLPGGVFNKGFVRAYARQIGLDEEETVTDYLAALRESQVQAQQILPDFRAPGAKPNPLVGREARIHGVDAGDDRVADNGNHQGGGNVHSFDRRRTDRRKQDPDDHNEVDHGQVERSHNLSAPPSFITPPEIAKVRHAPATASRLPRNLVAGVLLLLTVGLAVWNSRRHRESATKLAASSNQPVMTASAQPSAATPPGPAAATPKPEAVSRPATTPTKISGTGTSSTGASSTPAAVALPNLVAEPGANPSPNAPAVKTVSPVAAKPVSMFTVLIRADQTSWVLVTADGKPVAQETLIAPAHTSVRAAHEMVVRVGNAAGISFLFNGKEIPATGNQGEVKTYVFDAAGPRTSQQTQLPTENR
jgi:cytoskeletal protein RodZ